MRLISAQVGSRCFATFNQAARTPLIGQNTSAESSPVVLPNAQIVDLASLIDTKLRLTPLTVSASPNNAVAVTNVGAAVVGAYSKFRTLPTALLLNTSVVVKVAPGNIYGLTVYNSGTQTTFLKFYNSATSVIDGTAIPQEVIPIAPNSLYDVQPKSVPWQNFTTGLTIAATTSLLDTDNTAPATGLYASIKYL